MGVVQVDNSTKGISSSHAEMDRDQSIEQIKEKSHVEGMEGPTDSSSTLGKILDPKANDKRLSLNHMCDGGQCDKIVSAPGNSKSVL